MSPGCSPFLSNPQETVLTDRVTDKSPLRSSSWKYTGGSSTPVVPWQSSETQVRERHRYYSLTPSQTDPPSPTHEQQSLCSSAHCSCLVGSRHRRAPVKDRGEDCRYYKCPTVVFHTSKCLKTHPCGCQSDPVHSTESRGRVTGGSSEHSQTFA